jgi:hypothetical protein
MRPEDFIDNSVLKESREADYIGVLWQRKSNTDSSPPTIHRSALARKTCGLTLARRLRARPRVVENEKARLDLGRPDL